MTSLQVKDSWLKKWYPWLLTGLSGVALISSFWQAAERIHQLKNPSIALSCNINPIVDCGGVMNHKLAALFGFPNTFIGMVMFSMLFMAGLALIFGATFTQKIRNVIMALSKVALLFSLWFFWASLYEIGKICVFCLTIWPASIALFWFGLQYWLEGLEKHNRWQLKLHKFSSRFRFEPIIAIYLVMFLLFLFRFRDYYFN